MSSLQTVRRSRWAVSSALAGLGLLLATAPLQAAGPGTPGNPGSSSPNSPAVYYLQGDMSNPLGSSTTVFRTLGGSSTIAGWQFTDSYTNAISLLGSCATGPSCTGIYGSGTGTGVYGYAYGTDSTGVAGYAAGTGGYGVYGASGNIGVKAVGNLVGVDTTGTTAVKATGTSFGIDSTGDTAVHAAGTSYGGFFETTSDASTSTGVHAEAAGYGGTFHGDYMGITASSSITGTGVYAYGGKIGVAAQSSDTAVYAYGQTAIQAKGVGYGVVATSTNTIGVFGWTDSVSVVNDSGVFGAADTPPGVRGLTNGTTASGTDITAGVVGTNANTNGGASGYNAGIYGFCAACVGIRAKSESYYGLQGSSTSGAGVRATSSASYGLWASTTSGTGAYITTASGTSALRAKNTMTDSLHYALIADGNVQINGTLHTTGGIVAPVATTQGARLVYGEQATQNVLSDAGTATLKGGRAVITIDPLYAQTVNLSAGYRVFVTPNSADTPGLAVINKTGTSFEIRELGKGTGSFSVDWRIEAGRKGYEKERLAPAPVVPAFVEPQDAAPAPGK